MFARFAHLVTTAAAVALVASVALAEPRGADGYHRTGTAIQTANHWPFTIDVFAIWHEARELPRARSRQAMIDLDADKRFAMRMMRDLDGDKLRGGLRDGYRRNGFADDAVIAGFLSAIPSTLPNGKTLFITYDASAKQTRLLVDGGASASVDGVAFMKATWSIWFGNSKPQDIGDALLKDL
jgi:hypothetical protein